MKCPVRCINHWYTTDQTISWTITDGSINGHLPNGVAGYSLLLRISILAILTANPRRRQTTEYYQSPFYYGPSRPNSSSGSLNVSEMIRGNGCPGAPGAATRSSCVHGTMLANLANSSYGPVCYDPWPPYTYATLTGHLAGSVLRGVRAGDSHCCYDSGSGVASTMYQINGGSLAELHGPILCHRAWNLHVVVFTARITLVTSKLLRYANFIIAYNWQILLSVSKTGTGSGTMTSADGDINCGSICSYTYGLLAAGDLNRDAGGGLRVYRMELAAT